MKTKSSRYLSAVFALLFAAAFAMLLTAAAPSRAYADTYTVQSTDTLDDLQAAVNSDQYDTLSFPAGYYRYSGELTVSKNLTVQVSSSPTLSRAVITEEDSHSSLFHVTAGNTLTFEDEEAGTEGPTLSIVGGRHGIDALAGASVDVKCHVLISKTSNFGIAGGDVPSGSGSLTVNGGALTVNDCPQGQDQDPNAGGILWNNSGGIVINSGSIDINDCGNAQFGGLYMENGNLVIGSDGGTESAANLSIRDPENTQAQNSMVLASPREKLIVHRMGQLSIGVGKQGNVEHRAINMAGGTVTIDGNVSIGSRNNGTGTMWGIRNANSIEVGDNASLSISGADYSIGSPNYPSSSFTATSRSEVNLSGATADSNMATNTITGGSVAMDNGTSVVNGQMQQGSDHVSGPVLNANGENLTRFDLQGYGYTRSSFTVGADTADPVNHPVYTYYVGQVNWTKVNGADTYTAYVWAPATHVKFWDSKDRSGNLLGERTTIRGNTIGRVDGSTDAIEQGIKVAEGQKIVWHRCDNDEVWDPANTPVDADVDVYYTLEPPQPDQPSQPDQPQQPTQPDNQPTVQPTEPSSQPAAQPSAQPSATAQPEQTAQPENPGNAAEEAPAEAVNATPEQEIPETSDTVNMPFLVAMLLFGAAASGTAFYKMRRQSK